MDQTDRAEAQAARLRQLTQRHEAMLRAKVEAGIELTHAVREDERVRQTAMERYGTSEPDALRSMRDAMLDENDAKLDDFEACIDSVERNLAAARADG